MLTQEQEQKLKEILAFCKSRVAQNNSEGKIGNDFIIMRNRGGGMGTSSFRLFAIKCYNGRTYLLAEGSGRGGSEINIYDNTGKEDPFDYERGGSGKLEGRALDEATSQITKTFQDYHDFYVKDSLEDFFKNPQFKDSIILSLAIINNPVFKASLKPESALFKLSELMEQIKPEYQESDNKFLKDFFDKPASLPKDVTEQDLALTLSSLQQLERTPQKGIFLGFDEIARIIYPQCENQETLNSFANKSDKVKYALSQFTGLELSDDVLIIQNNDFQSYEISGKSREIIKLRKLLEEKRVPVLEMPVFDAPSLSPSSAAASSASAAHGSAASHN